MATSCRFESDLRHQSAPIRLRARFCLELEDTLIAAEDDRLPPVDIAHHNAVLEPDIVEPLTPQMRTWSESDRSSAIKALALAQRLDSTFIERGEQYDLLLQRSVQSDIVWLDVGCGRNGDVARLGQSAAFAVGVDRTLPPHPDAAPFVLGDLHALPFRSETADLVTLRFVVEHIAECRGPFDDLIRVLKPGGRLLLMTTNSRSPMIAVARLLPDRIKRWLMCRLFRTARAGSQHTYHAYTTGRLLKAAAQPLQAVRISYVQDTNVARRCLFAFMFGWHLLTRPRWLQPWRSNIIAVFRKPDPREGPIQKSLV